MGLILDLAVAALALAVVASLALLTWTLAVSVVHAVQRGREHVAGLRQTLPDAEARLAAASTSASTTLAELSRRTDRYVRPGDRSDR